MPEISAKKMLETILRTATLSAKEREAFENMWDGVHRYGGLSKKQTAWIENVYYKLPKNPSLSRERSSRKGFVNIPGITAPKNVYSLDQFKVLCPEASIEASQKIEKFFKSGGVVVELRPLVYPET